jgi:hypothetical protein
MSRATGSCRKQIRDLFTKVTNGKPFVIRPALGRPDGIKATTVNIMTVCGRQMFPLGELVIDSSYEEVVQEVKRFAERLNARRPNIICVDAEAESTYVYENNAQQVHEQAATAAIA